MNDGIKFSKQDERKRSGRCGRQIRRWLGAGRGNTHTASLSAFVTSGIYSMMQLSKVILLM